MALLKAHSQGLAIQGRGGTLGSYSKSQPCLIIPTKNGDVNIKYGVYLYIYILYIYSYIAYIYLYVVYILFQTLVS